MELNALPDVDRSKLLGLRREKMREQAAAAIARHNALNGQGRGRARVLRWCFNLRF